MEAEYQRAECRASLQRDWIWHALDRRVRDQLCVGGPDNDHYRMLLMATCVDLAGPDMIKFGIESKRSCEETSTQRFGEAVGRALESMRVICLEGMDAKL